MSISTENWVEHFDYQYEIYIRWAKNDKHDEEQVIFNLKHASRYLDNSIRYRTILIKKKHC